MEGVTKAMKAYFKFFGLIIIVGVAGAIGKNVSQSAISSPTESDIEQLLTFAANEINKTAPAMVDSETRLDKAVAGPGSQLTYEHTFVDFPAPGQNPFDVFDNLDARSASLRQRVCANEAMSLIFREGVTIIYLYKDKDGSKLFDVAVSPKDCSV